MRIVILGNSGSGKSTLARRLGTDIGIPYFHMDRLYWKPGWKESTDDELRAKVRQVMEDNAEWIIDGSYSRVLSERLAVADLALVLEVPVWVALWRVGKRWLTNFGRTRRDMGEGCREKLDLEFIRWIATWPQRRRRTYERLAEYPNLELLVLENQFQYGELVKRVCQLRQAEREAALSQEARGQHLEGH